MAKQTNSLAHTKWMCKYHIVFTPKYIKVHQKQGQNPRKKDFGSVAVHKREGASLHNYKLVILRHPLWHFLSAEAYSGLRLLPNPYWKLRIARHSGTLLYFIAWTDTRRCLACNIIMQGQKICQLFCMQGQRCRISFTRPYPFSIHRIYPKFIIICMSYPHYSGLLLRRLIFCGYSKTPIESSSLLQHENLYAIITNSIS